MTPPSTSQTARVIQEESLAAIFLATVWVRKKIDLFTLDALDALEADFEALEA